MMYFCSDDKKIVDLYRCRRVLSATFGTGGYADTPNVRDATTMEHALLLRPAPRTERVVVGFGHGGLR